MVSEPSVTGAGSSPREGGEHIPREGGEQTSHSVTDGFLCERHSERVGSGGARRWRHDRAQGGHEIDSKRLKKAVSPNLLQKRNANEMTKVDLPKIDSQCSFHD